MARIARIAWTECPYHVTHRGNRGDAIFVDDSDRVAYLGSLSANGVRFGLRVWAYCLMKNHVHLIVNSEKETSMAQCLGLTHRLHARRINYRRGWTGHLWANRFYSTPMDVDHLWAAVRYVELNPIRARLVARPVDFEWSSARSHVIGATDKILDHKRPFPGPIEAWEEWLLAVTDDEATEKIRRCTTTGRPCGSESFVRDLEGQTLRRLTAARRGPRAALADTTGSDGNQQKTLLP